MLLHQMYTMNVYMCISILVRDVVRHYTIAYIYIDVIDITNERTYTLHQVARGDI